VVIVGSYRPVQLRRSSTVDACVPLALVVARQSRAAARWLLPWLVWMPITLTIKLIALL
jgi:hypothetical protein